MSSNDTARPRFFKEAVQNKFKSDQEGRPIFDEREFVEIRIPGDKLSVFVGYVEDEHRERWPEAYAAFKRGEERAASGTPLDQWPNASMTRARVAELKAASILSVEELANIPDSVLGRLGMGIRELREQAIAYLQGAKEGAANSAMAARIAQLEQMLETLNKNHSVAPAIPSAPEPTEKAIEDCSDAELKAFIKERTGEPVRGNPSRETLIDRATQLATAEAA